jgi:ATP-dependent RNA circularization protein (DNA/RNA ligase family)
MTEYHKISGPFKRDVNPGPNKNKLIAWEWSMPEFKVLADIPWSFTEKIDGTNIRIIWDGHKPEFRGRTDKAQLHPDLLKALDEMFPEELLEQTFGANPAILYGEGYGAGIQKGGGNYRQDKSFILFDVHIGGWWLMRETVEEIATSLGIDVVPVMYEGTLREAVKFMAKNEELYSVVAEIDEFGAEGMVGTPAVPLFNRKGERIIVKLKGCDLYGLEVG